jgi:HK97 family phage major capsid protein
MNEKKGVTNTPIEDLPPEEQAKHASEPDRILQVLEEIRTLTDQRSKSNQEQLDAIDGKISLLQAEQKRLEHRIRERKFGTYASLPGIEDEADEFSFARAFRGILTGQWGKGFEKEVFRQAAEQKGMEAGNDYTGGYFVPVELLSAMAVELLYAQTVAIESGATLLSGLAPGPVEIPKITGGTTAYWVGENAAPTESTPSTGMVTLNPKRLAAFTKVSKRLIRAAANGIEGMVRNDMMQQLALGLDLGLLRGAGSAGEPLGVVNTPGISTVALGTDGGEFDWDTALDMQTELGGDDALIGRLGYVFQFFIKQRLKKQRIHMHTDEDTIGTPFPGSGVIATDQQVASMLGYPFKATTQLPSTLAKGSSGARCGEVIFANWADLVVAQYGGMELSGSDVTGDSTGNAFTQNQVWLMAQMEADGGVRRPASFCLVNDAFAIDL